MELLKLVTIVKEKLSAGSYEVNWDGSGYPSGIYFYRIEINDFAETKKIIPPIEEWVTMKY